jgi:hypothetical protein
VLEIFTEQEAAAVFRGNSQNKGIPDLELMIGHKIEG